MSLCRASLMLLLFSLALISGCSGVSQVTTVFIPTTEVQQSTATIDMAITLTAASTASTSGTPDTTPTPTAVASLRTQLPRGQYIVYASADETSPSGMSLYVMSMEGELKGKLIRGPNETSRISKSGRYIVYVSGTYPDYKLAIVDLDSSQISEVPESHNCLSATWSPDETKLAATCDGQIVIFDLVAKTPSPLTSWFTDSSQSQWDFPAWSPDGQWIAYYNLIDFPKSGVEDGLYLTDTSCLSDMKSCQDRTRGPLLNALTDTLLWSPDSRYLAIHSRSIAIVGLGDAQSLVLKIPDEFVPTESASLAWSPDGKWIAYSRPDGIFLTSPIDSKSMRVAETPTETQVVFWLDVR